jgi:prolipoprotein diacylglyceryltransferase
MLLIGILIVALLVGLVAPNFLLALFLIGIGMIFSVMALMKSRAPATYELSPRTTLAYGIIAIIIGLLWVSLYVQAAVAGYVLAAALIFFGLVFLVYTRFKHTST